MSWRLAMKRKKPPPGFDLVEPHLEEFEERMRDAMNEPVEDKMRNQMTWIVHKIHYEKNRFMYNLYYVEKRISKKLFDYLVDMKIADGPLIAKWRKPGYETLCSLAVIAKNNTNFRTTGICRVPLRDRHGQITPNVTTGCVSCASGDGGPVWWDDPVPQIVFKRRREQFVEEERHGTLPAKQAKTEGDEEEEGDLGGNAESEAQKQPEENAAEEPPLEENNDDAHSEERTGEDARKTDVSSIQTDQSATGAEADDAQQEAAETDQ